MDEDAEAAAWAQLECEARHQRETELISRLRKEYGSFRADIDGFSAEFQRSMRSINKRELHENE